MTKLKIKLFDLETDGFLEDLTTIHCGVVYDILSDGIKSFTPNGPKDREGCFLIEEILDELLDADVLIAHNGISFDLPALVKVYGEKYPEKIKALLEKFDGKEGETWFDSMVLSRLVYPDIKNMDFENLARKRWTTLPSGRRALVPMLELPDEPKAKMRLIGSHSLRAWGYRLKKYKGNYGADGDFSKFDLEMLDYCVNDILVNVHFVKAKIMRRWPRCFEPGLSMNNFFSKDHKNPDAPSCIWIEHQFYKYLEYQRAAGVKFDVNAANFLVTKWQQELKQRMREVKAMIPNMIKEEEFTPKVNRPDLGYEKGVPIIKREVIKFNPASNDHVIEFLMTKYDWKPKEFTWKKSKKWPKGKPKVTYEILKALPYKEAPLLARVRVLRDRIGLVKTSRGSWLKYLNEEDGRIHGGIIHNGTPTSRCRHLQPNLGNIPSGTALWGSTIRKLFYAQGQASLLDILIEAFTDVAPPETLNPFPIPTWTPQVEQGDDEYVLVGTDFDALEMRCMAEVLWPYDGGAFYEMALTGSKEDGTDAHTRNMEAVKEELVNAGFIKIANAMTRDKAKTGFYADIYGAWERKLGSIACEGVTLSPAKYGMVGGCFKAGLRKNIKGLEEVTQKLLDTFQDCVYNGKWPEAEAIDGRPVPLRKKSAVFNSELQTTGAILSKVACVLKMRKLKEAGLGLPTGADDGVIYWRPVLHVHDETQDEVKNDTKRKTVSEFKRLAAESFRESGEIFDFKVPIIGEPEVGRCWAETH